ncbi:sensor histidine kinase [Phreatobacter sp.]|uniref:sensor histidine kinase n=1 Tax=Phreatobacter sp. TaxID=1966341 RepID=UPI003F715B70
MRSLEGRLAATILAWTLLAVVLVAWLLGNLVEAGARRVLESRLASAAEQIVANAEIGADGIVTLERQPEDAAFQHAGSGWLWLIVRDGRAIAQSRSMAGLDIGAWQQALAAGAERGPAGERLVSASRAFSGPGRTGARLYATAPYSSIEPEVREARATVAWTMAALAAGLILVLVLQVRLSLHPLRRLVSDIDRMRAGELAALPDQPVTTLQPVAGAVNRMAADLTRMAERSRAEAADLAHAIKTPLSVIVLRAQSADPEIVASADQIRRQVERRLKRSRAGAPGAISASTPIRPVAEDAVLAARHVHAARGVTAGIDMPEGLAAPLAREDLEEIVGNLVDNAFAWASSRVHVRAAPADGAVILTVEDDGPGIPPDRAEAVLARGQRLDESLPGSGLGLAIVADILADHGGTLDLGRAAAGGLSARIRLPSPPQAAKR